MKKKEPSVIPGKEVRELRELKPINQKLCGRCRYHTIIETKFYCFYICITKKQRGCPAGWCDKYEPCGRKVKGRGKAIVIQ